MRHVERETTPCCRRGLQRISEDFRAFHVKHSKRRARSIEWGGAMFLGGRVRSPEPRAFVLRRACTSTSDGGGVECPPVGACSRRGLGSVYVVRRACTSDGGGGQCPPVDARARRGLGSRYVLRRACTGPTEREARRAMPLGGLCASAGVSGFRAPADLCTPGGAAAGGQGISS